MTCELAHSTSCSCVVHTKWPLNSLQCDPATDRECSVVTYIQLCELGSHHTCFVACSDNVNSCACSAIRLVLGHSCSLQLLDELGALEQCWKLTRYSLECEIGAQVPSTLPHRIQSMTVSFRRQARCHCMTLCAHALAHAAGRCSH
jgi:hypothetical protein